jgi:hypothetical protein
MIPPVLRQRRRFHGIHPLSADNDFSLIRAVDAADDIQQS